MGGELWVPGEPMAKGRPRVGTIGGKARIYTPKATQDEERRIGALWTAQMVPQGVPVAMEVLAYRERPAGHYRKSGELSAAGLRMPLPIKRPDLDNIVKLVLDGLNGIAFHDDSQVIHLTANSMWAIRGDAGVQIKVWEVTYA